MDTIRFVDTTIRDGHQSLWAENMTTGMMLPIAKNLDDAGLEGIELISGSHLKKTVRELKDDTWIREARISDEWNDYEGWKFRVGECHRAGLKSILNLIYSVSPKHSDAYFAERTRQAASLNPYRLCLKDPGGLFTPERMATLLPTISQHANRITVDT